MDETNLASRIMNEIVEPLKRMNIEAKTQPVPHSDGSTTGESTIGSDDSTIASSNMSLSSPESVGSVSSGSMTPDELESVVLPEPVQEQETGQGFLLSDRNLVTIVDALKGLLSVPVVEAPVPIVEQPLPIVEQPVPIVEQPVPIVEQPAPIVEEPAPIVAPNPITGNGFALTDENLRKIIDALKILTTSSNDLTQDLVTTLTKAPSETQEGAMMIIEINYGDGKTGEVVVHDGDDPRDLATKFIKDNGLNIRTFPILVKHISDSITEFLAESASSPPSDSSPASDIEPIKSSELGSFLTTAITDAILQKSSRFKPLIPDFKLGLPFHLGQSDGIGDSIPSLDEGSESGRSSGLTVFGSDKSSVTSDSGKASVDSESGRWGFGLPGFGSDKSSVTSDSGKATVGSVSSPESESGDSGETSLESVSSKGKPKLKLKKVVGLLKRLGKKPEPGLKLKNLLRTLKKFLSTGAESEEDESESDESESGSEESESYESEFGSEEEESEDGSSKRGPPAEASEENEDKYEAPDPFTNIGKISMPELNTSTVKYLNFDKDKFAKPAGVELKDLINISIQPEVK